jgi:ABC-type nickel/cobalt efflux system permease component RcnA
LQNRIAAVTDKAMKQLSHMLVWTGAAALFLLGCEQHDFDKTKVLHADHGHHDEHHDDHAGDHSGEHKDHKDDSHAKDDHGKPHAGEGDHGQKEKKATKEEPRDTGL